MKGHSANDMIFPYQASSPTLGKLIWYDEDELWNEIDRILAEDIEKKFTNGQQCYFNLTHCANPAYFLTSETQLALEEYMAFKRFKLPFASSLDKAEYNRIVIFSTIDEEYNAAIKHNA
jgi:hypothetical protein